MGSYGMVVRISDASLGGFGSNTWHVRSTDTPPTEISDLNALSTIIRDFYGALNVLYRIGTTLHFDGQFFGIMGSEGDTLEGDAWTVDGAEGSTVSPPAVAVVVGWKTGSGGRQGRGRTFLGPIGSGALEGNGTVHPTHLSNVRTAAEALVSDSQGFGNGAIGVYSPTGNQMRDFTGTATRDRFAVLRSRRD